MAVDRSAIAKWVWRLLRAAVTAGVLCWVLHGVQWRDHTWQVVSRADTPDGVSVSLRDASGRTRTMTLKRFDGQAGGAWIERGFISVWREIHLPWLAGALGIFWLAPALQALRWRRLLHVQDVRLTVAEALKLVWVGLFFNLFLLGAVGGDLVKAYYVSRHARSRAESMVTVLVDRVVGLLGLVWLSAAAMGVWLIWRPGGRGIEGGLPWAWLLPGVAVLLGGAVFYSERMRRLLGIGRLVGRLREGHLIRRLDRAVFLYRHRKAIILEAFGWTFLSHVCLMLAVYFVLRSLGIQALVHVLICGPIVFVATGLIPSIGGLGVQEYGFVLFFGPLAAGAGGTAVALAASLVYRVVMIATAVPGAGVMIFGAHLPSRAEMKRQIEEVSA